MFVSGCGYGPGNEVLAVEDQYPEFRTAEYPSVFLLGNEGQSQENDSQLTAR